MRDTKKPGVTILVSDKTDFKPTKIKEAKRGITSWEKDQCNKKSS